MKTRDVENQILEVDRKKRISSNDNLRELKHESSTSQRRINYCSRKRGEVPKLTTSERYQAINIVLRKQSSSRFVTDLCMLAEVSHIGYYTWLATYGYC